MWAITCLIGIAREVWDVVRRDTTLLSLQFEHTVTKTFFTSSEINELVSRDFLISLLKIMSSYESRPLFILRASSFKVTTAFLLKDDLRFSTNLIISGTMLLITLLLSKSEWCAMILLALFKASKLTYQSYDLI